MSDYPALKKLIELVAFDNDLKTLDVLDWPPESARMEQLANFLDRWSVRNPELYTDGPYDDEFEIFAVGAEHDKEALMSWCFGREVLAPLDQFPEEAFDGKYRKNFYK